MCSGDCNGNTSGNRSSYSPKSSGKGKSSGSGGSGRKSRYAGGNNNTYGKPAVKMSFGGRRKTSY